MRVCAVDPARLGRRCRWSMRGSMVTADPGSAATDLRAGGHLSGGGPARPIFCCRLIGRAPLVICAISRRGRVASIYGAFGVPCSCTGARLRSGFRPWTRRDSPSASGFEPQCSLSGSMEASPAGARQGRLCRRGCGGRRRPPRPARSVGRSDGGPDISPAAFLEAGNAFGISLGISTRRVQCLG